MQISCKLAWEMTQVATPVWPRRAHRAMIKFSDAWRRSRCRNRQAIQAFRKSIDPWALSGQLVNQKPSKESPLEIGRLQWQHLSLGGGC